MASVPVHHPDALGRATPPGVDRWLVTLPLVAAMAVVIVLLLALLLAVMLGGGASHPG